MYGTIRIDKENRSFSLLKRLEEMKCKILLKGVGGDLHYLMLNINRLGADVVKFVHMLHEVEKKSIFLSSGRSIYLRIGF